MFQNYKIRCREIKDIKYWPDHTVDIEFTDFIEAFGCNVVIDNVYNDQIAELEEEANNLEAKLCSERDNTKELREEVEELEEDIEEKEELIASLHKEMGKYRKGANILRNLMQMLTSCGDLTTKSKNLTILRDRYIALFETPARLLLDIEMKKEEDAEDINIYDEQLGRLRWIDVESSDHHTMYDHDDDEDEIPF